VAAVLSFVFPGLGQAYLGLRRQALIFAVPVLVVLLGLLLWVMTSGLTRAGVQLLNPTVAVAGAVLSAVLVLWWAAAIISAYRAGYHSSRSVIAVPIALVGILLFASVYDRVPLGASWLYSVSVADAGLNHGVDCTIDACNYGDAGPVDSGLVSVLPSPTPFVPLASGQTPAPAATDDSSDDYAPESDAPPTIEAGPTPGFDITSLDAKNDGWLNVLLLGLDTRCAGGIITGANTDTMIVVSINTSTNQVYMFSFPRDTAQFPLYDKAGGTFGGKLNQFAGWTKSAQNPDGSPRFPDPGQPSLAYEIGFLLGIPIDYYASINICGFPQLIDAVGGVDVCNTKDIEDPSYPHGDGTYGFSLPPGEYHMDGATALAYARSRHGSSDFARARRQQQLITSLRQAILEPANIARLPDIISAMAGVINTNFPSSLIGDPNNGLLALANKVDGTPTAQYVFGSPDWATHYNRQQTNGRSVEFLKLDTIAALSYQIFGNASLYAQNGPVPTAAIPQPAPSDTPQPGATPVC
jgi:LCP family protein required for cell wall assembly